MTKKSLIKPLISLFFLSFLLCTVLYGWMSVNESANTNQMLIVADRFDLNINFYYYDGTAWIKHDQKDKLSFSNQSPNDCLYFRIDISSTSDATLCLAGKEYDSLLDPSVKYDSLNQIHVQKSNSAQSIFRLKYEIIENTVEINNKTLYRIQEDGTVMLEDYLIEDVYRTYSLYNGKKNDFDEATKPSITNHESRTLKEDILVSSVTANETYSWVFGYEFNDEASLVEDNSNCYRYQSLQIGCFSIRSV